MTADKIAQALEEFRALLVAGWEWPDASAKVAVKFGLDQETIGAEFDKAMGEF